MLQVAWLDLTGAMKMTRTRALNISETGMAVELPEGALPLSMVRFQSDRFKTRGQGSVRHCRRVGTRFVAGLELGDHRGEVAQRAAAPDRPDVAGARAPDGEQVGRRGARRWSRGRQGSGLRRGVGGRRLGCRQSRRGRRQIVQGVFEELRIAVVRLSDVG